MPALGFQGLIHRFTRRQYGEGGLFARWRAARMSAFLELVKPPSGARIIDLGGTPQMWEFIEHDFDVTLVNQAGYGGVPYAGEPGATPIRSLEGDACDLSAIAGDQSYDIAFSNSVIEHVGDEARQAAFADEVRRVAAAWWIQTPSDRCPVEPHSGVPFYWKLPSPIVRRLNESWKREVPAWQESMAATRVLSRQRMTELFPASEVFVERRLGFEKSYALYRPFRAP